jgi:hypothetical protein
MPGSDAYICTEDEYKELVEYWTAEVAAMNERRIGELANYADLQDTMILYAD